MYTPCTNIGVSRTSLKGGALISYVFTIACPTATPFPQINVDTTGMLGTTSWARVQAASAPVRGTYTVGFNGSWTAPLNWNDGGSVLQARLLALGAIGALTATNYNDPNDGMAFTVVISSPVVRFVCLFNFMFFANNLFH